MAMACTMFAALAVGIVSFPTLNSARGRQLLPLSLAYAAHAAQALRSLRFLNVAIYNTLKRMTPVLVLAFKVRTDGHALLICP